MPTNFFFQHFFLTNPHEYVLEQAFTLRIEIRVCRGALTNDRKLKTSRSRDRTTKLERQPQLERNSKGKELAEDVWHY